jgi:membrane protease YdiL (CAAX protease family)
MFEAGLAPVALALGWALGQPPLRSFEWDAWAAAMSVLAAVPMLVFLGLSVRYPVGPLRAIRAFFDRELAPALAGCGLHDLALLSVAAGVGEEMLFRGVIQGALVRALGNVAGLATASLVFGLLHPISATYAAIAALLGAYLGLLWLLTGNLLTPILAHSIYDFVALVILLRSHGAREDNSERG